MKKDELRKWRDIFEKQIALDYSCSIDEVRNSENIFTIKQYNEGRRIFKGDDCLLKVICINGKLIFSATEQEILEWCRDTWKDDGGAWFFSFENLRKLENKLNAIGHRIADTHHFYLPGGIEKEIKLSDEMMEKISFVFYNQELLERFRGDNRFERALSFIEEAPDVIAVTAEIDGEIIGMAGASMDSPDMWQIGIDVLEKGKHMGLATILVTKLKHEIMGKRKLPFYGTSESHIQSQGVAVKSGFVPAWAELYTEKM